MLLFARCCSNANLVRVVHSVERVVDVDRARDIVRTIIIERSIEQADKTLTIEHVAIATTKAHGVTRRLSQISTRNARRYSRLTHTHRDGSPQTPTMCSIRRYETQTGPLSKTSSKSMASSIQRSSIRSEIPQN